MVLQKIVNIFIFNSAKEQISFCTGLSNDIINYLNRQHRDKVCYLIFVQAHFQFLANK